MKQQYIRPAIYMLALVCIILSRLFPQYAGFIPLALFPVFVVFAGKTFWMGQELYTYLERHFPEYYKKQKLFNGSVPDVWLLSQKEILYKLDETVLQMVKKAKFYRNTIFIVFALIIVVCVGSVVTKW